jgi:serine O-acetyltransferase
MCNESILHETNAMDADAFSQPLLSLCAATWNSLLRDAEIVAQAEPILRPSLEASVLRHAAMGPALADHLSRKLACPELSAEALAELFAEAIADDAGIVDAAVVDLRAVFERDPAAGDLLSPFLWFKGYLSLQTYRMSHWLWRHDRRHVARQIQSRMSERFAVDIHPAARLGRGILIDHGTGLVVGETAVVENEVSILQSVTLGGTGKQSGDRHPKIRHGVLIGAGAKVLGNIEVGEGAKVGAGSIVLDDVEPYTTVVGNPARAVGERLRGMAALTMDHTLHPPDYAI